MNVLVLGAKGMLGQQLAVAFNSEKVTAWDREELDITNENEVREKIVSLKPEIIINAAAYTDVDGAETNRETAFAVNETGVRNVALAAKGVGARLVHYSTDYVFPGEQSEGYREDHAPGPAVNVYGESKLAGEKALAEVAPEYFLLRTAWLFGPGGKNFVDTMVRLGKEKDELSVVDDQHGSPTFAKDLAAATRQLVTGDFAPGIYHTVNAGVTTWYAFAQEIFRLAGLAVTVKPISSEDFPRPARRPAYSILLNTKGPTLRGWQQALKEYISSVSSS